MTVEPSKDLLRRLTLAAGPPGAEEEVRGVVREALEEIGSIEHDRLGSILCEKKGDGDAPRVILDAHLDEVGFMVRSISREGRVRFVPLGGWWGHVLLAQRVEIITDGGKVPGVIASKPPHFLSSEERGKVLPLDSMTIDVGASTRDEVEELGVRTGDCIVPVAEFREMALSGLLSSKAFDDRAGVGVMVETLLALKDRAHPNTVVGVGAVQEEVGCRGAGTASELSRPDVAIILEGTPADDLPGSDEPQAALGKGPQMRYIDPTAISNRRLVRLVEGTAAAREIPLQVAVRSSGGTDARTVHLHGSGVPTVVIGVPARYIHTHVGLIHWQDYTAACELTLALVEALDEETVASLTRY